MTSIIRVICSYLAERRSLLRSIVLLTKYFLTKELSFDYMTVKNQSRENRVAYIKREFTVYNKKVSCFFAVIFNVLTAKGFLFLFFSGC